MFDSHRTIVTKGKRKKKVKPVVALITHDAKKADMVIFAKEAERRLARCDLIATGTTGETIAAKTSLQVKRIFPDPKEGDLQIGGLVASGEVDLVIFLRDSLTAQPHDPDISALLRVCDIHNVPLPQISVRQNYC